ncbi:MAG: hypothetical protein ABI903_17275 [Actinomycetota bacterium]
MTYVDRSPAGRIRTALTGINAAWSATLNPARRASGSHAMTSLVNPPLPIPASVLDDRAKAHDVLAHWSLTVMRGRRLHRVGAAGVPALCGFLWIHAAWLADYPKALADLESSAAALGQIAADNAPHRFKVGNCPGTTNDLPCPGAVKATVRADDDLLPSVLTCSGTPVHSWPAGEWRILERRLHMDEAAARRLALAIRV